MSHFYLKANGGKAKKTTTRCGDKKNGLTVQILGWNRGVIVKAKYNEITEKDEFYIYKNGGSNNNTFVDLIKVIKK